MPHGLKKVMSKILWSIYILRCGDGSLYTGIATDVARRFGEHVSQGPKSAKYLRGRLPLEIVYRREIGSRSEASKEELRIKRMGVSFNDDVSSCESNDHEGHAERRECDYCGPPYNLMQFYTFILRGGRVQSLIMKVGPQGFEPWTKGL